MRNINQIYLIITPLTWALIPNKITNIWNYSNNYKEEDYYSFLCFRLEIRFKNNRK